MTEVNAKIFSSEDDFMPSSRISLPQAYFKTSNEIKVRSISNISLIKQSNT